MSYHPQCRSAPQNAAVCHSGLPELGSGAAACLQAPIRTTEVAKHPVRILLNPSSNPGRGIPCSGFQACLLCLTALDPPTPPRTNTLHSQKTPRLPHEAYLSASLPGFWVKQSFFLFWWGSLACCACIDHGTHLFFWGGDALTSQSVW